MHRIARFLSVLGILAAAHVHAAEVQMLAPGDARGEERVLGTSSWLGLYVDGRTLELRPVEVSVESSIDPESPAPLPSAAPDVRVSVPDAPEPILLLRGGRFAAGNVPTAFAGNATIPRGGSVTLALHGDISTLLVEGVKGLDDEDEEGARMILEDGRDTQIVAVSEASDAIYAGFEVYATGDVPRLLWAGDIDADGRLDLLLEALSDEGDRLLMLYLSSEAGPGELVRVGARAHLYAAPGC